MNDPTAQAAGPAVRASDAEREQTVAVLRRGFADGRLTQAELEERAGAAYTAQTRAELGDLTADLPAAQRQPRRRGMALDRHVLCILSCLHPPAALVYWLLCGRSRSHRSAGSPGSGPERVATVRSAGVTGG
jgi:hypothetical protein